MSRQEWKTSYSEHMHAHTRMCARVHIRRRTTLVVELKTNIIPKNWITVIVHRRTPVVRQRIVPAYQYTRNMRACVRGRARLKNFRSYHPNLLLFQDSTSPFFLLPDCDTSRILGISQPRAMTSPVT